MKHALKLHRNTASDMFFCRPRRVAHDSGGDVRDQLAFQLLYREKPSNSSGITKGFFSMSSNGGYSVCAWHPNWETSTKTIFDLTNESTSHESFTIELTKLISYVGYFSVPLKALRDAKQEQQSYGKAVIFVNDRQYTLRFCHGPYPNQPGRVMVANIVDSKGDAVGVCYSYVRNMRFV